MTDVKKGHRQADFEKSQNQRRPRQERFSFPALHDWFAGEALKTLVLIERDDPNPEWASEQAYKYADAMMAERKKRNEKKYGNKIGEIKVGGK